MKIQDHPQSFYETFDIVIAGLDSIPARRWMNATMVQIAQEGNIIPLIDGGTEGMLFPSFCNDELMERIQGTVEGYSTYC
jgi:molybdopterin/thiamine biosynthesis adenylyltransferase